MSSLTGRPHVLDGLEPTIRVLKARKILMVSPQPWNHLQISKHHYAEELARDNHVVFLEPPGAAGIPSLRTHTHPTLCRLQIATWRPFTPKLLRFHAYPVYCAVMARNAAWLSKRLGNPDIIWSFDFNVFPDLTAFGAPVRIFHPVDVLKSTRQIAIADTADLVISVSDSILSAFAGRRAHPRTLLVNHGLSSPFADLARDRTPVRKPGPMRCGYFGNLDLELINFDLLAATAEAHPQIQFHFWGPHRTDGPFASKLLGRPNVVAHGVLGKDQLARAAAQMDLWVLAYLEHPTRYDRSNSHKLLEYMSTGKTIVATKLDCYTDDPDLVRSAPGDADFSGLFADTITSIERLNGPELAAKRKAFCQQFTYTANVARIDAALARLSDH
jgi:hypothetical protein